MDNFFEILIYLIIIISFLSSFFKKKEPQKKPGSSLPLPESKTKDYSETSVESKPVESYDILKEIENIFKEGMGVPVPKPQPENQKVPQEKEDEKYQQVFEKNYDREDIRLVTAESRALKSREDAKKLDEKILREAEVFEELLNYHSEITKRRHPIVDKLHNPQSLKEFVLISEILGKPVAYKR
ncbi:hypothetical protein [Ignavibacterium sp.]|uniref:hypothetical protein n=1 Tax=Ignavibacterium sp. TaxID=2651167 RepID=UPI00307FC58C